MTAAELPADPESPVAQSASLYRAIVEAQRWITSIYRLDLDLRAEQFVVDPGTALRLLPPDSPRSGLVVVEEPAEISVGIYIDAADVDDPWTVIEETSHLLYLAWLADRDWSVSRLVLEFQSEVDRYAVARLKRPRWIGVLRRFHVVRLDGRADPRALRGRPLPRPRLLSIPGATPSASLRHSGAALGAAPLLPRCPRSKTERGLNGGARRESIDRRLTFASLSSISRRTNVEAREESRAFAGRR